MSELLFIRHAETDMAGTFCGHSDPPLNERGAAQVCQLIEQLAAEPIIVLYTSDLRRALDTARPVAQALALPCIPSASLREIHFGAWEGLTWAQIEHRDPEFASRWIESFPALSAPDGESFATFETRVLREVDRLIRLAGDRRIAVVTHAGVMRVVLCNLLGCDEQQAWEITRPYCSSFLYAPTGVLQEAMR